MISRTAECCFWLIRYIERTECIARLLRSNRTFVLDVELPEIQRWHPLIIVVGEKDRFDDQFSEEQRHNGDVVQDYLTWNEDSPISIRSSVYWARENARTIREVISLEMWEAVNRNWHWLTDGRGEKLYRTDRDKFYRYIINSVNMFYGVLDSTLSHETTFDFMRLGMHLERAGQTARALDVKYHAMGPTTTDEESPAELTQWLALLKSCAARDAYLKRSKCGIAGTSIFEFLVKDEYFPRSVYHCCMRAQNFLSRIKPLEGDIGETSMNIMEQLNKYLRETTTKEMVEKGIHNELTYIVDTTMEIAKAIHSDYFNPYIPENIDAGSRVTGRYWIRK